MLTATAIVQRRTRALSVAHMKNSQSSLYISGVVNLPSLQESRDESKFAEGSDPVRPKIAVSGPPPIRPMCTSKSRVKNADGLLFEPYCIAYDIFVDCGRP